MPKYSFIVPVYQCQAYLPDCINSILQQKTPDWELLLIDDGSSDKSGMLCDEFAASDPRIHVFHKENGGAASARNVGLDHAVGQYVLFIDGDDTISPEFLLQIEHAAHKNTLTAVRTDACIKIVVV